MVHKTIRICTWNIHFGRELDKILDSISTNSDFKKCDCLMLQEASIHNGREDAREIAAVLGKRYAYIQVTAQTVHQQPQANAFIWNAQKIQINTVEVLEMPPFHPKARVYKYYMRIFDKEHAIAVFLRWVLQKRISLVIEGNIYGKSFRMYIVHFDIVGLASKKKQMAFLVDDSNLRKAVEMEIIAGDLNTFKFFQLPSWASVRQLAERAGFQDVTTNIPWTYVDKRVPSKHKLDAIFIRERSAKFEYKSWSNDIPGSDHIPIFANIVSFHEAKNYE